MTAGNHPRLWKWLKITGVVILGFIIALSIILARLSPLSQHWVVKSLQDHYHSKVTLKSFHVTLFPRIAATGGGLVLADPSRPGGPPLASLQRFTMETGWLDLLRHPSRVKNIRLYGLTLNVPPRKAQPETSKKKRRHHLPPFYLENVEADGTVLNTFSSNPSKPPRVFSIAKLRLRSVGVGKAMWFQATLTNPKPIGEIQTYGAFGPWNPDDPGETPVSGNYAFSHADLSTIHGLAGILSSTGSYHGALDRLLVDGDTDTPDFALGRGGHAEPLKTHFHAIVDGITGQTLLQPVRAVLGDSVIIARGGVLRERGVKGSYIALNVVTKSAKLADVLGLAVKSRQPPMVGDIHIAVLLRIPPGPEEVEKKMEMEGSFSIKSARFTDAAVEEKVTHLSATGKGRTGKGQAGDANPESAAAPSNFNGQFRLANSVISFSSLTFDTPGAQVNLRGKYDLRSEQLDFRGKLMLQAELSQMTTGIKSLLLKPLNPLFKRENAGTVVPIRISGDREHPSFAVNFRELLRSVR